MGHKRFKDLSLKSKPKKRYCPRCSSDVGEKRRSSEGNYMVCTTCNIAAPWRFTLSSPENLLTICGLDKQRVIDIMDDI